MVKKRACVIGSGFGGLSVAIRLQASGFETTVFERRDKPGGRAYVYQQGEHKFDAGPTVITAPHTLEELFNVSQKKLEDYIELLPVSPFYRLYWEDGTSLDYSQDEGHLLDQIRSIEPKDVEGYQRFYQYTQEVFKEGYEKLVHVPFLSFWDMVAVSPQLLRLKAYRSVYSMVASYIKNPHLREAFSFHSLLIGGNPFRASSIYTLIHSLERKWGVFFAKGGTGALVQGLVRLFEDLGGQLVLDSEIDTIQCKNGKVSGVTTKQNRAYEFDLVVSNADVVHTYDHLLRDEPLAKKSASSLLKKEYSMSLFLIYFGTNRKYKNLAHHNVLFGPRYQPLLQDIFDRGVLSNDFSLYLHAPSLTDPSMAPSEGESFYVLSPVPHLGKWQGNWETEKEVYKEKILDYLEKRYLPDLRKHLTVVRTFTPLDFRKELNAHLGSAFSLEPLLNQSASLRVKNKDLSISGLYFVGAGTHPGAGVPGVINSGKATWGVILKDFHIKPLFLSELSNATL